MDSYYERPLRIISILGLNLGNFKGKFWNVLCCINFSGIVLVAILEILYPIFLESHFLDKLISIPGILVAVESCYKFYNGIRNSGKIKQLMKTLDELYLQMDPNEQIEFRQRSFKLRQPAIFFGSGYIALTTFCNTLPIVVMIIIYCARNEWIYLYPYHFWWPFDNTKYFVATYTFEAYAAWNSAIGVVALDVLCAMITALIVTHFQHLGVKFQSLISRISEDMTVDQKEEFTRLVNIHICLNQQCEFLNEIFGFAFFIRIIFSSFVICCSGFVAVTQSSFMVLAQFAAISLVTILHTFFVCLYGDIMEEKSSSLADALNDSKWYEVNTKLQKDFMLVTIRAQKPNFMTATSFFKLGLPGFLTILSSAFSYFTLVRNLYTEK